MKIGVKKERLSNYKTESSQKYGQIEEYTDIHR